MSDSEYVVQKMYIEHSYLFFAFDIQQCVQNKSRSLPLWMLYSSWVDNKKQQQLTNILYSTIQRKSRVKTTGVFIKLTDWNFK